MFTTILIILCVALLTGSIIGREAIDLAVWLKKFQPEVTPGSGPILAPQPVSPSFIDALESAGMRTELVSALRAENQIRGFSNFPELEEHGREVLRLAGPTVLALQAPDSGMVKLLEDFERESKLPLLSQEELFLNNQLYAVVCYEEQSNQIVPSESGVTSELPTPPHKHSVGPYGSQDGCLAYIQKNKLNEEESFAPFYYQVDHITNWPFSEVTTQIGLEPIEPDTEISFPEISFPEISPPEIQSHCNPVIFTKNNPTVGYYQGLPRLTAPCHAKLVKLFLSGNVTIFCEPSIIQACKNSDNDSTNPQSSLFHQLVCLPFAD